MASDFEPKTVKLSLVEASDGKVGSTMDQIFLTCFQYDGHQGKYAFAALGLDAGGRDPDDHRGCERRSVRMLRREQRLSAAEAAQTGK